MKKRFDNLLRWVLGGAAINALLLFAEILIAFEIALNTSNFRTNFVMYYAIMAFATTIIYIIIALIKVIKFERDKKLYNINEEKKAINELSSEFKSVTLIDSKDIPEEKFQCQAKVDENGKIICKIHVDYQKELNSYGEFLYYFHLDED